MADLTDSYNRLDEIDPELFRRVILGDETAETTSNGEANGIMSRYEPVGTKPAEPEQGFLTGILNWMRGNTDDPERLADAIVPQTIDLGPDLSNWEAMPELKTIILPPPPPVSVTPITPGSTNLALYGDRLGKGTITSSNPTAYTAAPAGMVAPSVQLGATPAGTLMTRPDGTPRSTQELEQLTSDALPNIQVDAEAGLMSPPVQDVDTFKIPEFKSYETAEEMPDLEILARTIEAEASGEPFEGKIAVGSVIANRVASGSYGGSGGIKGVILKKGQFSPWNSYTKYAKGEQGKDMLNLKASEESYKAANDILTGNYTDETGGASHYVNPKVSTPDWLPDMKGRKKGTVTIGNHLFGNADNERVYDGKAGLAELYSKTTDQPVEQAGPNVKDIQGIIGATVDGQFGTDSREKALAYLKDEGVAVPKDSTNKQLMDLVINRPKAPLSQRLDANDARIPTPAYSSPVSAEVFEAVIEDQLDQDIAVSETDTLIEPPQFLGEGERISESTRSGQVSGITKNYSLNGVERSIIDVSETTESDPSLNYPAEPSAPPVDVQNVVLHYTGGLYTNGVRHYMNSFGKAASAAYLVDRRGQIYETFDPTVKGYHVAGSSRRNPRGIITNSNSIGVEVEASDTDLPTQAQLEATAWLSDYLIAQYGAQRVVAHPQANIHKGHVEGYDLVNYWRSQNNLPELTPSNKALENLFTFAPSVSLRPQARQGN